MAQMDWRRENESNYTPENKTSRKKVASSNGKACLPTKTFQGTVYAYIYILLFFKAHHVYDM